MLENIEFTTIDILYFLSLDSPIVEQNLLKKTDIFSVNLKGMFGFKKDVFGTFLYIENFSKDKLYLKEKAILKAQEIIDEIPQSLNAFEKSKYLCKYLHDNISYKSYEISQNCNYLYDALCKGETSCDGFANAYSLLCNMCKIPCYEKIYLPSNGGTGHTWNSIQIDESWFNVDATITKSIVQLENKYNFLVRFCYSDELQSNLPNWHKLLPKCIQNKSHVDCSFDTESDSNFISSVINAFNNNDRNFIHITIKKTSLSNMKLQEICNNLGGTLNIIRDEGANQNSYFLIKEQK